MQIMCRMVSDARQKIYHIQITIWKFIENDGNTFLLIYRNFAESLQLNRIGEKLKINNWKIDNGNS